MMGKIPFDPPNHLNYTIKKIRAQYFFLIFTNKLVRIFILSGTKLYLLLLIGTKNYLFLSTVLNCQNMPMNLSCTYRLNLVCFDSNHIIEHRD